MQIVIDIPERMYLSAKEDALCGAILLVDAIKNGTPLPKKHGRLGDLDALEKEMINGIKAGNYEEGYEIFAHINDMDDCLECVKYAQAIIEADTEVQDADSN